MPADEFPSSTGSHASGPSSRSSPPTRRSKWSAWLTILVAVCLVLLPMVAAVGPGEMSQWHLAAAKVRYARGETAKALARLDAALEWSPDDAELWLLRAEWNHRVGNVEQSRRDVQKAVQLDPDSLHVRRQLAATLQLAGLDEQAITVWEQLVQDTRNQSLRARAELLNALAYARAVANADLRGALAEINQALQWVTRPEAQATPGSKSTGSKPDHEDLLPSALITNAAMLDTRGFILWRLGRHDQALNDLDRAVVLGEKEFEIWKQNVHEIPDQVLAEEITQSFRKNVAVIRYHRLLVHESLGNRQRAEVDRRRVRDLGFEPHEQLF